MMFRIILFKMFNKKSIWKILCDKLDDISLENFCFENYCSILEEAKSCGKKIYTDAYMSCANKVFGYNKKHENHIALLKKMFIEDKM